YLDELSRVDWDRPVLSSAADKPAASGPSGVKMRGPYEYVPPSYWLLDTKNGGAFGFDTEVSPGAAVPPLESLREMLGPEHAWPSMIWHLYDYYLRPGGGYFGTKKACEPVHVQYSYDDRSIVVVNDAPRAVPGLKVRARVLDFGLAERFARETTVDLPADGVV